MANITVARLIFALLIAASSTVANSALVVCLDPGHPSETSSGARVGTLSENRLNWTIAKKVEAILTRDGIAVVMTKHAVHEHVTNRQRADVANKAHAAMFIRLHCDTGSGNGFTWYYPDHAGKKGGVTGPSPVICAASRRLAVSLNATMIPLLRGTLAGNPIKTDAATFVGSRQGGVLTGSIFAQVPTALIEMCYLNHARDAAIIASVRGQDAMATAIAAAIEAYLRSNA